MQRDEAMTFISQQMETRWPDWKPNAEQLADWAKWLGPYEWDAAKNAVREHAGSQTFNKRPNPAKVRPLLAKFQPPQEQGTKSKPDNTIFVMYEGGGRGTLSAGYYYPIIVSPREQHLIMKAAENGRKYHEDRYGGIWKVYTETTAAAMNKIRSDFHSALVDGNPASLAGV